MPGLDSISDKLAQIDLAQIDLGTAILKIVILLGFFLVGVTIFRSFEIGIKIYLDKRKKKGSSTNIDKKKGFDKD